jgi:divalent metal cation (Fe/Co/Zn/Cd) transporter
MLFSGVRLTISNFKVLIDLPLAEIDQLKIMGILAEEYDNYKNLGNIYTRSSFKTRFIEVELYFKKGATIKEIMNLKERMKKRLQKNFPNLQFVLIPLRVEDKIKEKSTSNKSNKSNLYLVSSSGMGAHNRRTLQQKTRQR